MSSSHLPTFHVPVLKFAIINGPGSRDCGKVNEMIGDGVALDEVTPLTFTLSIGENHDWPVLTCAFKRELRFINSYAFHGDGFYFTTLLEGHKMTGFYNKRSRTGWLNADI